MRLNGFILMALASVAVAGCARVPRESGFGDVKRMAADRGIEPIHWNQGTPADRDAEQAVHTLLQKELSVDSAAQIALLNNRRLQATFEELGIAQADLVEAGLLKNPVFSIEARFPGQALEADIFQDVLDVFILPLRKRVAESQFEAAKLRVTNAVLDLWSETRSAYYALQAAEQMMELRRSIVQATEASADAAKKLHDAGNIKDVDYANEQAMYEQAKVDLSQAEAEVFDGREHLNKLMGLWGPDSARWTVPSRLPELPKPEVEPAALESLAISQRSDLAAARQDLEALARSYGLTRSTALIPEANVGLHSEREPDGKTTVGPSIELPLPIFNQGQAAIARAQAKIRQAQQNYIAIAIEIRADVRAARNRMFNARGRAEYHRRVIVPLRHQIVEQTQLEYNAMLVGIFQLLQAKQGEIEAGRAYVEALRDYWTARAELEKAVGGRLKAGQPTTQPAAAGTQPAPIQPQEPQPQHGHQHGGQQ